MKRAIPYDSWRRVLPVLAVLAAAWAGPGWGADGTWTNLASGLNWSTAGNWSNSIVADGSGSTANFNTLDLSADTTVHLDTPRTNGILVFGDSDTNSAGSWILDDNSVPGNILTLAGPAPTVTVNALGAGKSATISGVVAGSGGLTKTGAGTLILANTANSYSGGTVITGGTVQIDNEACLGTAATITITNGGTLLLGPSGPGLSSDRNIVAGPGIQNIVKWTRKAASISGVISGSGSVNFGDNTAPGVDGGGGGRFSINAANTYTGDTIITFVGTRDPGIVVNNVLALQNSTLDFNLANIPSADAGSMVMWGVASPIFGGLKGDRNWNISYQSDPGNLHVGNNNQDTTFSGILSSSSATTRFTKIGTGTLTLTGNNSFAGALAVKAGTLSVPTVNNAGSSGPLGNSTNVVTMGDTNGVTGILKYTGGTAGSTKAFTMATGGAGGFQVETESTTLTISGGIDGGGGLTKKGPGTLILNGAATYLGDTRVEGGILGITNAYLCDTSSVVIATGAKLDLNFTNIDTICSLNMGGEARGYGLYGAFGPGTAFITGSGRLMVTNGPPPKGMILSVK